MTPGFDDFHEVYFNNFLLPPFGENHHYSYDEVDIPTTALQLGNNTLSFLTETIEQSERERV